MHPRGPSTDHRTKRQFQPAITDFFSVHEDFDYDERRDRERERERERERLAPPVPGQVQADLLSAGMRVRKSVPEGYKTHNKMPTIQTTLSASASTLDVKPHREPVPEEVMHQRELLPFCGLHKIGGYAEQPTTNLHLYGGTNSNGARPANAFPLPPEAFSQPFSSQSSTDSGYLSSSQQSINPRNPSKRSWQDEDDKPVQSNFFFAIPKKSFVGADMDDVPVSPLSETPPQNINMLPTMRQFAQPKSRRGVQRTMTDDSMDMDLENTTQVQGRVAAGNASDFEEADFLAREIDMGGI